MTREPRVTGIHDIERHLVALWAALQQEVISAIGVAGLIAEPDSSVAGKGGDGVIKSHLTPIKTAAHYRLAFLPIRELERDLDQLIRRQQRGIDPASMAGAVSFFPVLVFDSDLNQRGRGRFGAEFSNIEAKRRERCDGDKEFPYCHGDGLPDLS